MSFIPLEGYEGKFREVACATTQTIVKGDALADNGLGYLAVATSSTQNVPFIAWQTVTTTADGQKVLCLRTEDVIFLADCDAAWSQTDVGTLCDLAAKATVNPDISSHDVFEIIEGVGVADTDTQVKGKFRMQADA